MAFNIKKPRTNCDDLHCPFHGKLSIRGQVLEGTVISNKMNKTVIIRRNYIHYIPKFNRYERRHSHTPAHNPPCINAKEDDRVKISECRPISKTVTFVVIEKMGGEKLGV